MLTDETIVYPDFEQAMFECRKALEKCWGKEELIAGITCEARISFAHLSAVLSSNHSESDKKIMLRDFLAKRWQFIRDGEASYFMSPYTPINQACVRLAHHLADKNEPLITLLVPSLTVMNYSILGETLVELTETVQKDGFRDILFNHFILSESESAIIPLLPWFRGKLSGGTTFTHHLFTNDDKIVSLTAQELQRLEESIFPFSVHFFEELRRRENVLNDSSTLAFAMNRMVKQLKKNRNPAFGGSTDQAGDVAYYAIRDFLLIWNDLNPIDRDRLGALLSSASKKLSWHLRLLQSGIDPTISTEDRKIFKEFGNCVEENGEYIQKILNENFKKFERISIGTNIGEKVEALESPYDFKDIDEEMVNRLALKDAHLSDKAYSYRDPNLIKTYQPAVFKESAATYNKTLIIEYACSLDSLDVLLITPDDYLECFRDAPHIFELAISKISEKVLSNYLFNAVKTMKSDALITALMRKSKRCNTEVLLDFITANAYKRGSGGKEPKTLLARGLDQFELNSAQLEAVIKFCMKYNLDETLMQIYIAHPGFLNLDIGGTTPLKYACARGSISLVTLLLEKGADPDICDHLGNSPLHYSLKKERIEQTIPCLLIGKGCNIEILINGIPLLVRTIQSGYTLIFEALVKRGVDLNLKDREKNTLLHYSAYLNNLEMVKLLVENGADVNAKNINNETPLKRCCDSNDNDEVISFLVNNKAEPCQARDGSSLLRHALIKRWRDTVTTLLAIKVNSNNPSLLESLFIDLKLDIKNINNIDENKNTALHCAAFGQNQDLILMLLDRGCDPDIENVWKLTAFEEYLQSSKNNRNVPVMLKFIRKTKTRLRIEFFLNYAHEENSIEIIEALHQYGANLDKSIDSTGTVMNKALDGKNIDMILYLLEKKARFKWMRHDETDSYSLRRRITSTVHPLSGHEPQAKVLGTPANALDYLYENRTPDAQLFDLLSRIMDKFGVKSILSMKNFDYISTHILKHDHLWNTPLEMLRFHAALKASTLRKTNLDHPSYGTRLTKAAAIVEAIQGDDPHKIFEAIEAKEVVSRFWRKSSSTSDLPIGLNDYREEVFRNDSKKSCFSLK